MVLAAFDQTQLWIKCTDSRVSDLKINKIKYNMGKNMKRLNTYHRLKVTAKQCFEGKSTVQ